jgi:hypothetical protein
MPPPDGASPPPAPTRKRPAWLVAAEKNLKKSYFDNPSDQFEKLTVLWGKHMPEDEQIYWRDLFQSKTDLPTLRERLQGELNINLYYDNVLEKFLAWVDQACLREAAALRMEEEDRIVRRAHPDWTLDQVRDEVIWRAYNRTLAEGDFDLGLKVVRMHLGAEKILLDRAKFELEASERCYDDLPGLQAIRQDSNLTRQEQMRRIRLKLFGRIAEEQPQPEPLPPPQPK